MWIASVLVPTVLMIHLPSSEQTNTFSEGGIVDFGGDLTLVIAPQKVPVDPT